MKFAPDWMLPGGSRDAYNKLISSTIGNGLQSNKWGYVHVIQWGTICATIQSLSGGIGFAFKQAGDAASWGVYWGANLGLWGALFTAVGYVKSKQSTDTKEITIAAMTPPAAPASPPTKTVKTEKTSGKSVTTTEAD